MYVIALRWLNVFPEFGVLGELNCFGDLVCNLRKVWEPYICPWEWLNKLLKDRHRGLQSNVPLTAFKLLLFSALILFSRRWRVIKRFSKPSPALPVPFRPPLLWCHLEIPPLWSSIWEADSADNWCRGRNGGGQRQRGAFNSSLLQHHSLCTIPNSSTPSN